MIDEKLIRLICVPDRKRIVWHNYVNEAGVLIELASRCFLTDKEFQIVQHIAQRWSEKSPSHEEVALVLASLMRIVQERVD